MIRKQTYYFFFFLLSILPAKVLASEVLCVKDDYQSTFYSNSDERYSKLNISISSSINEASLDDDEDLKKNINLIINKKTQLHFSDIGFIFLCNKHSHYQLLPQLANRPPPAN